MADIDVVKRSGSRAWLWWLLAAIALVVLMLMFTRGGGDVRAPAGTSAETAVDLAA